MPGIILKTAVVAGAVMDIRGDPSIPLARHRLPATGSFHLPIPTTATSIPTPAAQCTGRRCSFISQPGVAEFSSTSWARLGLNIPAPTLAADQVKLLPHRGWQISQPPTLGSALAGNRSLSKRSLVSTKTALHFRVFLIDQNTESPPS